MRCKIVCEAAALVVGLASAVHADTFQFKVTKQDGKWACMAAPVQPTTTTVAVNVLVDNPPAIEAVAIKATITPAQGAAVTGDLTKSAAPTSQNLWTFSPTPAVAKASKVSLSGTVEKQAISCEKQAEAESTPTTPVSRTVVTAFDLAAASWLDTAQGQAKLAAARALVERDNAHVHPSNIRLLPHLPSGAKAPPYPTSISERHVSQVVLLVPIGDTSSVAFTLTRCETVPNYRVAGDFAAFQAAAPELDFNVVRIGNALSCGADKLEYSLAVTKDGAQPSLPVPTTLPVRPVYHLAATAVFGFDTTNQSTFEVRDGKIAESIDRVGPGLLVGGTYFIGGVDYADMRPYHHFANPFVAVSLASPKDRFVVGTTITYRGGISAAVGLAMNHVPALKPGFAVGDAFAGSGDVPQKKKWVPGFYIGIAVDDKLYASFKKLDKGGSGGGAKPAAGAATPAATPKPKDQ
jgi:hypothetical protein